MSNPGERVQAWQEQAYDRIQRLSRAFLYLDTARQETGEVPTPLDILAATHIYESSSLVTIPQIGKLARTALEEGFLRPGEYGEEYGVLAAKIVQAVSSASAEGRVITWNGAFAHPGFAPDPLPDHEMMAHVSTPFEA